MDLVKSSSNDDNSFRFHISVMGFDHKPDNNETSNVIVTMSTSAYYNLNTAIEALAEGHPIIPAQLSSYGENRFGVKADYFTSQQLFLFDIDSRTDKKTGEVKLTAPQPEDTIQRLIDLGLIPAFWYPTFSHQDEMPKYSIGFVCDKKITSKFERRVIIRCFSEIIGKKESNQYYVDTQTFNENRLFFGTDKGIQVLDKTARFTVEQLLNTTTAFLTDKGSKNNHTSRTLKLFAERHGLAYDKDKGLYLPEYANATNSIIDNNNRKRGVGNQRKFSDLDIPIEKVIKTCILAQRFNNLKDIFHNDRIRLMSNVLHIRGGEKWYRSLLYEHRKLFGIGTKADYEIDNWKKNGKHRIRCAGCSYREQCPALGNNIIDSVFGRNGVKVRRVEPYEPIPAEHIRGTDTAEGSLEYHLRECIEIGAVNAIRADCGIGKTKYIHKMDNVIIAEKTNECVMQVVKEREKAGLETIYFPDLQPHWTNKIKLLYQIGAVNEANIEIRKLAKEYREIPFDKRTERHKAYIDYVEASKRLKSEGTTAVMTIDRLLNLGESFERTVIFDEHPLNKLTDIDNVEYKTIEKLKEKYVFFPVPALKKIIDALDNGEQLPQISRKERRALAREYDKLAEYDAKVFKLISANRLRYTASGITCYRNKRLPAETIIILSGTIQEDMLKLAFPGRKINFFDLGNVELKGKIIQHVGKSWSRKYIQENMEEFNRLVEEYSDCKLITYKMFREAAHADINFGAVEGLNKFAGCDLAVIGTPNHNPKTYIDIAIAWGKDEPKDLTMRWRLVRYMGFEFYCNTFDNEVLRAIHIFSVYDELMQAVYRSRPIDNECTTYVYSNFPIPGAEIHLD